MWISYKTILVEEFMRFIRIWVQTIFPPIITTLLYLVIFGELIGQRIGTMENISYIKYIVPGIILMALISNSYANTVSSFFFSKFNHSIEELLVSPTPYWIIIVGYVSGGVLRGIIVSIGVFITTLFFVDFVVFNWLIVITVSILTAIFFSLLGLINAIFAKSFDDIAIIPTFILTPMIYLGGVFYSIRILPEFWQNISKFNPIYYMLNSFRFGFFGIKSTEVGISIIILLMMIVALFIFILYFIKKDISFKA